MEPLSAATTATRDLFGNPTGEDHTWIAQHATLMAAVWPILLTAVFLPLSIHRYRNLNR